MHEWPVFPRIRHRSVVLALMIAMTATFVGAGRSANAQAVISGTCAVSATLSFSAPIMPIPQVVQYGLSGSSVLNCASIPTLTSASFHINGSSVASCAEVTTLFGAGTFGFSSAPSASVGLTTSSGSTSAQQWIFPGTDPGIFNATATLSWVDSTTNELANCYTRGGTTTMTLVGTLVYEDPKLP